MKPWQHLPSRYAPPMAGDAYPVRWRADLGPGTSVGQVANYLDAFQTALDLGERWGMVEAEHAAVISMVEELREAAEASGGEVSLDPLGTTPLHGDKAVYAAVHDVLYPWKLKHRGGTAGQVPEILRSIAAQSVPTLLQDSPRPVRILYENPIEIVIIGGGFAVYGAVQLLRIIRDWGPRKRIAAAAAGMAEDAARESRTRANVVEHLGREIVSGNLHVPPSQLSAMLTRDDISAITTLAGPEPTLELPASVAQFFGETSSQPQG